MADLKDSKTHANLQAAFAVESQANHRYLYFAQRADVEGHPRVAALFRSVAEGETGHALGLMEFLAEVGDPATGEVAGDTEGSLRSAVGGEVAKHTELFPRFARTAREEGFPAIAEWFETLASAEESNAVRFRSALETAG